MKKSLVFVFLIGLILFGACNLPLAPANDGSLEQEAVAATMTAIVAELNGTATAKVEDVAKDENQDHEETSGPMSEEEQVIEQEFSWCPAVAYVTHRPGKNEIIYWPVNGMGEDYILYENFTDSIFQAEALVLLGDNGTQDLSMVYFKAQDGSIYEWNTANEIATLRDDIYRSHLINSPSSEKLAYSIINNNRAEVYVSSVSAIPFAQPLLRAGDTETTLDPTRMIFDDSGNLLGLFVTYADYDQNYIDWSRYGYGLKYIDMSLGESRTILNDEWIVLDVSQAGQYAAVVKDDGIEGLQVFNVNNSSFSPITLCEGCKSPGAALFRPDAGLIAWTETFGDSFILRVANANGDITFEMDAYTATEKVGAQVDALQPKGWLNNELLLLDSGFSKNFVFVLNIVTGEIVLKSNGYFLSLVYDPALCE